MRTHTPKLQSWISGSTITCQSLLASCCSTHSVLLCSVYMKCLARHQGRIDKSKRPTLLISETCGLPRCLESSCPRSLHCYLPMKPNTAEMLPPQRGSARFNSVSCLQNTCCYLNSFACLHVPFVWTSPSHRHAG